MKTITLAQVHTLLDAKNKQSGSVTLAAVAAGVSYNAMYAVSHWHRQPRGKILDWLGLELVQHEDQYQVKQ